KDRLTGLQLGADDYLVKPFNREEVVKRIGALLERRRNAAPPAEQAAQVTANMLFDRATGLPTVPMVLDRLKEILIDQGQIGIVFIDIEQFEQIEVEYGWAFFDEFLRRAAEVLTSEAQQRFPRAVVATSVVGGSSLFVFFESRGRSRQYSLDSMA